MGPLESSFEVAPATRECLDGAVKPGTVGGIRMRNGAQLGDRPVVTEETVCCVDRSLGTEWIRAAGAAEFLVDVTGRCRIVASFRSPDRPRAAGVLAVASRVVNSIPVVCAAPPGILTAPDAPVPRHWAS